MYLRRSPLNGLRAQRLVHHQVFRPQSKLDHSPWRHSGRVFQPRTLAGPASLEKAMTLRADDIIHGFQVQRTKQIPELGIWAIHMQHRTTGAEYIHLARNDDNNVFSIGFKTDAPDDTGVPHILEHTTLCGGHKYPVRDPFFKMLRRSLSNFMNAFTAADYTSYPFATTNQQDFENLLSVYLDATLSPLLKENDFLQEGWRLGFDQSNPGDDAKDSAKISKDIGFKGVVYNEMKGQMTDSGYLFYVKFQDRIFPAVRNSGGDPEKMTDLTWSQLKTYHATHYHPSNARLMTYGNMPLEDHARLIDSYLSSFQKRQASAEIRTPIEITQDMERFEEAGPLDPMLPPNRQSKTSLTWTTSVTSDVVETFALGVLSSLLLDGYGSPMYTALIEAGLGTDFSPNTGFDGSARKGIFSIGLNGVHEGRVAEVHGTIRQTLIAVSGKGLEKSKVDGILHQLELALKHKTANFGVGLITRVQPGWFNGVDAFDMLAWNDTVNMFKARMSETRYLEDLMQKYLIDQPTMSFTMTPDAGYAERLRSRESAQLDAKKTQMISSLGSEAEMLQCLSKQESLLRQEQDAAPSQDLSCLPSVHVKDIPRQGKIEEVIDAKSSDVATQWRIADTNELTYFRAVQRLPSLSSDLRMVIPLFSDAIMRLGTKTKSMEELEDLIKLNTGGICVSYHSSPDALNRKNLIEGLSFSGYALDNKIDSMYDLLRQLVQETDFDSPEAAERIKELLWSEASGTLDSIANAGHAYAQTSAESCLSRYGQYKEQIGGLSHAHFVVESAKRSGSEGLGDIIAKLKQIQSMALSGNSPLKVAITCGRGASSQNEASLNRFLSSLPHGSPSNPQEIDTSSSHHSPSKVYHQMPFQVSYTASAIPTVPYTHEDNAKLVITSQLLTHKHLHHEVREKGGAYGGGAYARGLSGVFGFYSYRDPTPRNTLEIFQRAGQFAADHAWSEQDLEEAKLSTFQSVDAPKSVSDEGMTRFLNGIDHKMQQQYRERLLDVTAADVRDVAQRYLVDNAASTYTTLLGENQNWIKPGVDGWSIRQIQLDARNPS